MISCNLDFVPISAYTSNVVFANPLPVVFKLESDLFPINTVDTVFNVSSASDANGYAQITLTSTSSGYVCGNYVVMTGTYEGMYRIKEIVSSSSFVIDTPFIDTGTYPADGTAQKWYDNYFVEVEVYAGIPTGHYYNTDNPSELVTTLRVTPDLNNIAWIDISSAIRSKFLPIENDVCSQTETNNYYLNDRRAWVAFYIKYREVYDEPSACVGVSTAGAWETSDTFYAINGTSQFQYQYGNNAGEYVLNDNNLVLPTKFLTTITTPTIWEGKELDVAFFLPTELLDNDVNVSITSDVGSYSFGISPTLDEGVYRILLGDILVGELSGASYLDVALEIDNVVNSETKRFNVSSKCTPYEGKHVSYVNTLGGWDYIYFGAGQDTSHDVEEEQEITRNIFTEWESIFTGGTTQADYIRRKARKSGTLITQRLTKQLQREYSAQLSATVKMQEIIELSDSVSCLDVANRKTILPTNSNFAYSDTNKDYVITLEYKETNETLSQWQ